MNYEAITRDKNQSHVVECIVHVVRFHRYDVVSLKIRNTVTYDKNMAIFLVYFPETEINFNLGTRQRIKYKFSCFDFIKLLLNIIIGT